MNIRTSLAAAVLLLLVAGSAAAALSPQMQEWGKGPVQHLMTKEEASKWKAVTSDEQAQQFIDLFWAKRDPSPGTAVNEYQARFDQLVKTADERFVHGKVRGSMTDRGKVWVLFGPPSRLRSSGKDRTSNIQEGFLTPEGGTTGIGEDARSETWIYEKEKLPKWAPLELEFVFLDRFASGEYKLGRGKTNVNDMFAKAASSSVVNANATAAKAAPQQQPQKVETVVVPGVEATPAKVFKTESLKVAVDEFRTAKSNPYKNAYITYGESITAEGDYFVPVQVFVPRDAGLAANANLTFFAVVEDAQGNVVGVWEEPAKLSESKSDLYYDKSLTLPAGKYNAVFGLADSGKPVVIARNELDLAPLTKEAAGASRLLLSNNLYALTEAQQSTDPFAFGGIKVVPKGDRTFQQADELWYFFELRNPGLDATGAPKVQVKVDVEGTTAAKKKIKRSAPLSEAVVQPLKGVTGHYGVGSSIPLSGFEPGDYTLKLKVIDTNAKQTYNMEQPFTVKK